MSKVNAMLAVLKGQVSDEPPDFECASFIDTIKLFCIIDGTTERNMAELLLHSEDFMSLDCYYQTHPNRVEILDNSREIITEFLTFLYENAQDINSYLSGIHNDSKSYEQVQADLDNYFITYFNYFFYVDDVLQIPISKGLNINKILFNIQLNNSMCTSQRVNIVEISKKAHVDTANKIISGMQNRIIELSAILETTLASITDNVEYKKLQAELDKAKLTISKLEEELQSYEVIFDESNPYTYAPELAEVIKLWRNMYLTDRFKHIDSHRRKFEIVAKEMNLDFSVDKYITRLRQITTPKHSKEVSTKKK